MDFNIILTSKIIIDHCRLLWTTMDHHYQAHYGADHEGDVLVGALKEGASMSASHHEG